MGFWGFGVLGKQTIIIKMKYTRKRRPRTKKTYRKKAFRKRKNLTNKIRYTKQKFTRVIELDGAKNRVNHTIQFRWFGASGGTFEYNLHGIERFVEQKTLFDQYAITGMAIQWIPGNYSGSVQINPTTL